MTTAEEYGTELEPVDVVDAELVEDDDAPGADEVAVPDPVDAILAALETDAKGTRTTSGRRRPRTATRGLGDLGEFHDWLAERTGTRLPLDKVTVGTFVSFVTYLDQAVKAPPTTVERSCPLSAEALSDPWLMLTPCRSSSVAAIAVLSFAFRRARQNGSTARLTVFRRRRPPRALCPGSAERVARSSQRFGPVLTRGLGCIAPWSAPAAVGSSAWAGNSGAPAVLSRPPAPTAAPRCS